MALTSPVFANDKDICMNRYATRNILKFVVGSNNVYAAHSVQHFNALVQRNNWDIWLVKVNDLIRRHADGEDIAKRLAVFQQSNEIWLKVGDGP